MEQLSQFKEKFFNLSGICWNAQWWSPNFVPHFVENKLLSIWFPSLCPGAALHKRMNSISQILLINMHSNYCHLLTPSELKTPVVLSVSRGCSTSEDSSVVKRLLLLTLFQSHHIREHVLSWASSKWVAVVRGGKEWKERDEAEVRKGDMEKTSRCACSDGAACEPLLRLKLGSACPSFILCVLHHVGCPLGSFCSFPLLSSLRQSPPLFVPSACWYVGGRPDQSVQAVRQLDVSQACVGKPGLVGLSDLMRGCTRFTLLDKGGLFTCLQQEISCFSALSHGSV